MDSSAINKTFENKLASRLDKTEKTVKPWNMSTAYSAPQFQEGNCRSAV